MVCWNMALSGSLFHSTGATLATPRLHMAFLEWNEETEILFPQVKLLDLIKDGKWGCLEKFMALNMRRLYLKDTI